MKIKTLILIGCLGFLTSCASNYGIGTPYYGCHCNSCGCVYRTYQSQCGAPSCTYNKLDLDNIQKRPAI